MSESLEETTKDYYIINTNPINRNKRKRSFGYRKSQEEIASIKAKKRKQVEPIVRDLENFGLEKEDYNVFASIGIINAYLTPQQAQELKKKPYITNVQKDSKIKRIQGQKEIPQRISTPSDLETE